MAWLGDEGGRKVQLVKWIPGTSPGGWKRRAGRGRSRRRGGTGEKFKPKRKDKRRWKERRGRCEGEQKRLGSPSCRPWTQPEQAKSLAPLSSFVAIISVCECKTPFWTRVKSQTTRQGTTLSALTFPSLISLPFHLYPFCTSLVFMLPFPDTPYSPHTSPQQHKLTFSPIDLLSLSIKCAEQARHTVFFLLGSHGAWWMGKADAGGCRRVDSSTRISSL